MANTIKIKRSASTAAPSTISAGELAYSEASTKLYYGAIAGSNAYQIIGGKLYTDMLDHTAGTLTASSAILVDSNSKIDVLNIDNITLNEPSIITSIYSTTDVLCNGDSSGSATVTISGGIPNYFLEWGGNSIPNVGLFYTGNIVPEGVYPYSITDLNGCNLYDTITITAVSYTHLTLPTKA